MSPGKSLELTIIGEELESIGKDLSETLIDSILDEGVLKEIPIISSVVGGFKIYSTIRERFYIKKLYKFLYELQSVSREERQKFVVKFSKDEDKTDFFEKVLFLIDRQDDVYKSTIVGKLFAKTLREIIVVDDFIRCTLSIEQTYKTDLVYFSYRYNVDIYNTQDKRYVDLIKRGDIDMISKNLSKSGLLDVKIEENIHQQKYYEAEKRIKEKYSVSKIGRILLEHGFEIKSPTK